jgi:uncharacterized protein
MLIKILFFVVMGLLIYKFFGGKFPKINRTAQEKKLEDDTLVECETCHTYVTVKESIIVNGKYYCCQECTL